MTELLLDLILAGLGGRGETRAQRVACKFPLSVRFGEIPGWQGRSAIDAAAKEDTAIVALKAKIGAVL